MSRSNVLLIEGNTGGFSSVAPLRRGTPLLPPSLQPWEAEVADTSKQIRTPHVHKVAERNSFMEEVKLERERQQKGNHVC